MKRLAKFVGLILLLASGIFLALHVAIFPFPYSTTDVADYGNYIGNINNETPTRLISSFFPEKIEDYFSEVSYSYRAHTGDTYAFEAYLEFTIEDAAVYESYLSQISVDKEARRFTFDPKYTEYVIAKDLHPGRHEDIDDKTGKAYISIHCADIRIILCNDEEQRIIFVALGVFDGGIADTRFLTVFFDRFQIDPTEYVKFVSPENSAP